MSSPDNDGNRTDGDTERGISGARHKAIANALCAYITARGYVFDAVGGMRRADSKLVASKVLPSLARDFAYAERFQHSVTVSYLIETLETIADRCADDRRRLLTDRIMRGEETEAGKDALRAWLKALTGADDETDFAVMLHWMWLVKRGIAELKPEHHIMPILSGPQGGGKSYALSALLSPLQELILMPCDASILTDDRRAPALCTYAVAVLDEMQGVRRADAEALKQTITAENKAYRPMRSNGTVTIPVRCRFIGTTNETVEGLVNDTTGARRFYDIKCVAKVDWCTVNTLSYETLWTAISEKSPCPLAAHLATVRERQGELKRQDSVSLWAAAEAWEVPKGALAKGMTDGGDWLPTLAIRQLYTRYCRDHTDQVMPMVPWGRRLQALGFIPGRQRFNNQRFYGYKLPNNASYVAVDASF